jgi:tetratricopeptide (TPR) repeat protein
VVKPRSDPACLNSVLISPQFSQLGTTGFVRTAHVSNRTVGDVPLESAQKSPSSPETPTSTSKISKDELKNMSVQTLTELKQQIDTLLEEHTPRTKSTKRPSSASQLNRSTEAITRRVSILTSEDYTFKITQLPSNKRPKQVVAEDEIQEFRVLAQTALKDGNMKDEAAAYYSIAVEYDNSGHYAKAINYYNKFLAVVKEVEDVLAEALAYNRLGSAYHCLGTEKYLLYAIECHRKHEELTSDQGNPNILIEVVCCD